MWKPTVASVLIATASAQTPGVNPFAKAAPDVEEALRTRVNEFYQDHVSGKYRKAEALVADESKDGFYAAEKPLLEAFRLGDVIYSDNYTKAKVTIVGKMTMMFLGMGGPQKMEVPFPSYWKLEEGKWVWYIFRDPNRMTPFGQANAKPGIEVPSDPAAAFASAPNVSVIQSGVKTDKSEVKLARLAGSKDTVTLTNTLPGAVSLAIGPDQYPELNLKVEPAELKGGEKAVLTVQAVASKAYANRVIRVVVKPSNQAIDVNVKFQ